ncbi:MAG: PEGA domain-containing protein [Pseudomonadota bacterium]
MKKGIVLVYLPAAFSLLLFAVQARGQVDEEKAKKHFKQAAVLYKENNYAAALIEFKASYKAKPNWKVLYFIGVSLQALHKFVEAEKILREYLQEGDEEVPADKREVVEDLLAQLGGVIGSIDVKTDVEGASVYVNGKLQGKTPLSEPLRLPVGNYTVEIRKTGYEDYSKEIELPGEETVIIKPVLEKSAAEIVEVEKEEKIEVKEEKKPEVPDVVLEKVDEPSKGKKKKIKPAAFYAMTGLTGALVVGTVVVGIMAMRKHNEFDKTVENEWRERIELRDEGDVLNDAADGLLIVTAASALTMIILAVKTDFGKKEKKSEKTALKPKIACGGTNLSLTLEF